MVSEIEKEFEKMFDTYIEEVKKLSKFEQKREINKANAFVNFLAFCEDNNFTLEKIDSLMKIIGEISIEFEDLIRDQANAIKSYDILEEDKRLKYFLDIHKLLLKTLLKIYAED